MNFNAVTVTMFGIGAILIYCAIKDQSPKEVVTGAFSHQTAKHSGKSTPPGGGAAKRNTAHASIADSQFPASGSLGRVAGSFPVTSN